MRPCEGEPTGAPGGGSGARKVHSRARTLLVHKARAEAVSSLDMDESYEAHADALRERAVDVCTALGRVEVPDWLMAAALSECPELADAIAQATSVADEVK